MDLFAGHDSLGPWTHAPDAHPACRTVAEPPATNGAQRGAIISTSGERDMSSWRSREVVQVDDEVTFQAARKLDHGQLRGYGEDFGQVNWSQQWTPASVSGSCDLLSTGVRSYGDSGMSNAICSMVRVREDVTCIRVGKHGPVVPVSGLVIQELSTSGAGQAVETMNFGSADVRRPWREVGRASAGVQLTSPGTANAAEALVGLSAVHPGRSREEFQRDVVSSQVLVQPIGTGRNELPLIVTTAGQFSLLNCYQSQIAALQEEMTSLRRQVATEYGYATDGSGVGSVNLRNMAIPPNQLSQSTQQSQRVPEATTAHAPTSAASICSVQSSAAVEQPVTTTATTTRPSETAALTRDDCEDTLKSSKR